MAWNKKRNEKTLSCLLNDVWFVEFFETSSKLLYDPTADKVGQKTLCKHSLINVKKKKNFKFSLANKQVLSYLMWSGLFYKSIGGY